MAEEIVYSDRYTALGIEPNGCPGDCEGTGFVPIYMSAGDHREGDDIACGPDETDPAWIEAWERAEAKHPASDGWHFVRCPRCNAEASA